mmetsp:Transcript_50757/g.135367  ORF Transcript_50757/g.135367 Transcript_50757/m.135367 type:complete len:219 (+) Transcript_50757:977-1633(+)
MKMIEFLQPLDVVELLHLFLNGFIHDCVVLLEIGIPPLQAREGLCSLMCLALRCDRLDVDEFLVDAVHIHAFSEVLLAREECVRFVCLESAFIEPVGMMHLRHALIHGESAMIVLHFLDLVIEARPHISLLVTPCTSQRVDVISAHTILVQVDVVRHLALVLRSVDQVLQCVITTHGKPRVLVLVHEHRAHGFLDVFQVLMSRTQLLQHRERHSEAIS